MRGLFWVLLMVANSSYAGLLCDWPYRTQLSVQENSGTTLTDYQVLLTINSSNLHPDYQWTSNGYDLRIIDSDDNTALDFWIDSWNQASKTASIWVRFPSLVASQNRSVYLYYGNAAASNQTQVPPVFTYPGIKFHTRRVTADPSSKNQAFSLFNAASDNVSGYGCKFITDFTNISNSSSFPGGQDGNFIAYSESYFQVRANEAGTWRFRYGADFGRGGGLYVNGTRLEEQWNANLWWNNNWGNTSQTLEGSISLSEGYHKLEIIGAEDCCDGGITVQFRKPWGSWTTFRTSDIDIRSRSCPVALPTITFGAHESCSADLSVTATAPALWVRNSPRELILSVVNNGPDNAPSDTALTLNLDSGLLLEQVQGNSWSCSGSSGSISCAYSELVGSGDHYPDLVLGISAQSGSANNAGFSATVDGKAYDFNTANNTVSGSVAVRTLILPAGRSCAASSGLWTRFFNTQSSSVNYPTSASQFQTMVDTFANETYLDGQTIFSQVDGSGNPFDNRGDEYYLTIFDGYLYVPTDGDWWLALDGDDAVELRLNDTVRVSWYGAHGANNGPNTSNDVRLGLARGYHKFEFRHQEYAGGDVYRAYWSSTTTGAYQIIPAASFSQCSGVYDLQLNSTAQVISDPVNGSSNPKAIPGAVIDYSVRASNAGTLSSDPDSTVLVQAIAADSEFYVGTDSTISPVTFVNGSGNNRTGLTFTFDSLSSTTDSLDFSSDGGNTFGHTPVAGADGFDPAITHFRLILNGSMNPTLGNLQPYFDYQYRVRLH